MDIYTHTHAHTQQSAVKIKGRGGQTTKSKKTEWERCFNGQTH